MIEKYTIASTNNYSKRLSVVLQSNTRKINKPSPKNTGLLLQSQNNIHKQKQSIDSKRCNELLNMKTPNDCKEYLKKYIKNDLKQLGISTSALEDDNNDISKDKNNSSRIIEEKKENAQKIIKETKGKNINPQLNGKSLCISVRPRLTKSSCGNYELESSKKPQIKKEIKKEKDQRTGSGTGTSMSNYKTISPSISESHTKDYENTNTNSRPIYKSRGSEPQIKIEGESTYVKCSGKYFCI